MSDSETLERAAMAAMEQSKPLMRITEPYARTIARRTYFWAWPMVNIFNRRLAFDKAPEPGLMNGVLPLAPLNTLSMLHNYVEPDQRWVACPNQDVVYGAGIAALDRSPVIVQVPDFGSRFWVYQVVDLRTDSFAQLGAMYGTRPGFYMLVGPDWQGERPNGVAEVFRAGSNTAMVVPRIFQDDTAQDRDAIQEVISQVDLYALDKLDGTMRRRDWAKLPKFMQGGGESGEETKWVFPETFFDQLPVVLADARPLPGEEAIYREALSIVEAAKADPTLKAALIDEVGKTDREVIGPLLQFRNWGVPMGNSWTRVENGASFGTDYFARTAVAKSNILVNASAETQYLYQDLDSDGKRLNGANTYQVTFAKGEVPPVQGFWSLTLYDEQHFFVPNPIKRYSIGTKNRPLKIDPRGSLTIYVQAESPGADREANWLPAPKGDDFTLYMRGYWPKPEMVEGRWVPPPVTRVS